MSKERSKQRFNVTLSPQVKRAGHRLAKAQNRTFSNLLEVLITQENSRQTGETKPA